MGRLRPRMIAYSDRQNKKNIIDLARFNKEGQEDTILGAKLAGNAKLCCPLGQRYLGNQFYLRRINFGLLDVVREDKSEERTTQGDRLHCVALRILPKEVLLFRERDSFNFVQLLLVLWEIFDDLPVEREKHRFTSFNINNKSQPIMKIQG